MVLSVSIARDITLGEALDATNLTWTTYGDAEWFGETTNSYDGVSAAQSGAMQDGRLIRPANYHRGSRHADVLLGNAWPG
jgi:hypothetical protein